MSTKRYFKHVKNGYSNDNITIGAFDTDFEIEAIIDHKIKPNVNYY